MHEPDVGAVTGRRVPPGVGASFAPGARFAPASFAPGASRAPGAPCAPGASRAPGAPCAPGASRAPGAPGSILVVGLGNPILGDDAVGWHVADAVEARLRDGRWWAALEPDEPVIALDVERLSLGGLRLMERLIGYERAVIVDALETGDEPPGTVRSFRLEELPERGRARLASAHDASLAAALDLGRSLGAALPVSPWVVAVEARLRDTFSDELSPEVAAAVARAADQVMALVSRSEEQPCTS